VKVRGKQKIWKERKENGRNNIIIWEEDNTGKIISFEKWLT